MGILVAATARCRISGGGARRAPGCELPGGVDPAGGRDGSAFCALDAAGICAGAEGGEMPGAEASDLQRGGVNAGVVGAIPTDPGRSRVQPVWANRSSYRSESLGMPAG